VQQSQEQNDAAHMATMGSPDLNLTEFAHDVDDAEKRLALVRDRVNEPVTGDQAAHSALLNELKLILEELKRAYETLANTRAAVELERQNYHELIEFGPNGYLMTDRSGVILEANRVASDLLGIPAVNLVGKQLPVYIPAQYRQDFRKLLVGLEPQFDTFEWEGRMRRRPGIVFDAALMAASARNPKSRSDDTVDHPFIRWILRDVTHIRRQAEIQNGLTKALITTLNSLATEFDLNTFLGHVLTVVGEQLDATLVTLWYYERAHGHWTFGLLQEMRDVAGEDPAYSRRLPAHEWRLWHELVREHRAVRVENLLTDPRIPDQRGDYPRTGSLLLAPMLLGEEVLGLLRIYCAAERSYDDLEVQVAQTLAQQAALAIQLERLVEGERQSVVLRERNRMAQEMHDVVAQGFTGILIQLEAAEDALNIDSKLVRDHLVRARELAGRSLSEARRSVYALRPELLESQDLPEAIERIVDEIKAGTGLAIQFQVGGPPRSLPADIEGHLLRIVREALTNILKHAAATQVEVTLSYGDARMDLMIVDDGRGMASAGTLSGGIGLTGMRERAIRMGGRFQLDSAPDRGTRITVTIPIG
jgi:PAS domain S-box-containing protein